MVLNQTKPNLYLEKDLFSEDELCDTYSIISQYFNIKDIDLLSVVNSRINSNNILFGRYSLNIAKVLKMDFRYCDCIYWVPPLRKYIMSPHGTYFNDMNYFAQTYSANRFPIFLRPCNGFKSFSGQVFPNKEKLIEEWEFMRRNKNIDTNLMCMNAPVKNITREWRTIFINRAYCSGSRYMTNDELDISSDIDEAVIELAKNIAKESYFDDKDNFVIDICESEGNMFLLEINSFECSSFYGADLDKIYKTWSTYYD